MGNENVPKIIINGTMIFFPETVITLCIRCAIQWITSRSETSDLRNLIGDICCFVLLTPLTAISAWLCISGAVHYSYSPLAGPAAWETVGLLSLSIFLIVVYLIWCLVGSLPRCRFVSQH